MKTLITGSSGLIGSALADSLEANGHEVVRLLRGESVGDSPCWDPEKSVFNLGSEKNIDAVIHLAADNIAEGRWNARKKSRIMSSRVQGTKLLAEYFAAADQKPRVIIFASAVGIYGDRGEEVLDETSSHGEGFLADVCRQWEGAATSAGDAGIRVVHIRLGVVLSATGGALKKMLLPFRMGVGGAIGSGKQYMSWASICDVVEMIQFIMANDSIQGAVNITSPYPVTNHAFTRALGRVLNRPTICRMPALVARIVFGEMADEALLASTRAIPEKLTKAGYRFRYPEIEAALDALLRGGIHG